MFNALELKVPPLALIFLFGALMWLVSAYSVFTIAVAFGVRPYFLHRRISDRAGRHLDVSPDENHRQSTHTGSDHDDGYLRHLPLHPYPDVPGLPLDSCWMGD